MTPFLIDLACHFETVSGLVLGPWHFSPPTATLRLHGRDVEPCGWQHMEAMAGGDPDALRALASLREDVERRLRTRAETGSLWGPR